MKKLFQTSIVLLSALLIHNCSNSITDGGGGSETTNSITICTKGNLVWGKCASSAMVSLFDTSYNPVNGSYHLTTIADSNGNFCFEHIESGCYNFYSKYDSAGIYELAAMIQSMQIDSVNESHVNGTYNRPYTINCKIQSEIPENDNNFNTFNLIFFLKGTPFISEKSNNGNGSVISDVPPGNYDCDYTLLEDDPIETHYNFEMTDHIIVPAPILDTLDNSIDLIIYVRQ